MHFYISLFYFTHPLSPSLFLSFSFCLSVCLSVCLSLSLSFSLSFSIVLFLSFSFYISLFFPLYPHRPPTFFFRKFLFLEQKQTGKVLEGRCRKPLWAAKWKRGFVFAILNSTQLNLQLSIFFFISSSNGFLRRAKRFGMRWKCVTLASGERSIARLGWYRLDICFWTTNKTFLILD